MKDLSTMKDDIIHCFTLVLLGLGIWAPFISEGVKQVLGPFLLLLYLILGLVQIRLTQKRRKLSPEEQRDLERESRDERARMIRDRAAWSCWMAEFLILMVVSCALIFSGWEFAYISYWISVGHYCLFIAMRWWLNRKY